MGLSVKKVMLAVASLGLVFAVGCGGGGGGGGAAGGFSISMNGGDGDTLTGGAGGYISWDSVGWAGSHLTSAGTTIDTNFTLPAEPTPDLGDIPLIVSANTIVDVYVNYATGLAAVADGVCFLVLNDTGPLYRRINVTTSEVITGLQVNAGCTLTLGLNWNWGGNSGQDSAYLYFEDDIVIRGTVKVKDLTTGNLSGLVIENRAGAPATTKDMGCLYMYCGYNLFIATTGVIDLSGVDAAASTNARGGFGGVCEVYGTAAYSHGTIDVSGGNGDGTGIGGDAAFFSPWGSPYEAYLAGESSVLVNTGPIYANGGNGTTGGRAGGIYLYANSFLYNTANLTANGGEGVTVTGGDVYYTTELYSAYGSMYNRGDINCNGGDGATGGGDGGNVYIYAADSGYIGDLFNSGDVTANGGDTGSGTAGSGNQIYFEAYGGDIRNTGNISANGGDTAGSGTVGGGAGYIEFYCYEGYDYGNNGYVRPGELLVTGNMSLNGGDGGTGGSAGYITVSNEDDDYDYYAPEQVVRLAGYTSVSGNGGLGTVGGNGGYLDMYQEYGEWPCCAYICGPMKITGTALNFNGGRSSNGTGASGGYVNAEVDYYYPAKGPLEVTANINCIGGNGSLAGGYGGYVELYAKEDVTMSGSVNCSGGDGTGVNAGGGDADSSSTYVYSTSNVKISGTFTYEGGVGTGNATGGNGGDIYVYSGLKTTSTATYNFTGGSSGVVAGTGGDGGYIDLFSDRYATSATKAWNVSAGAANTDGTKGYVQVDWVYVDRP